MRRPRWFTVALMALGFAACDSELREILEGRQCDASGQCLDGYTCDTATNTCVKPGGTTTTTSESTTSMTGGSSTGGSTGTSGGGTTGSSGNGGTTSSGGDGGTTSSGGNGGAITGGTGGAGGTTGGGGTGGTTGSGGTTGGGGVGGGTTSTGCDPTQMLCGADCVDTQTDPSHCGNCNTVCETLVSPPASGTSTCASGACSLACDNATPTACTVAGGKACVNLQTDSQHCGNCPTACVPGKKCAAGACAPVCPPGLTLCGAECVNLQTDGKHCGACNGVGGLGGTGVCGLVAPVCQSGKCKGACDNGMTVCSDSCTDLTKDPAHCGACGTVCTTGQLCVASMCKAFVYVSGAWECNATYPTFCTVGGQALCTAAPSCP